MFTRTKPDNYYLFVFPALRVRSTIMLSSVPNTAYLPVYLPALAQAFEEQKYRFPLASNRFCTCKLLVNSTEGNQKYVIIEIITILFFQIEQKVVESERTKNVLNLDSSPSDSIICIRFK